MWLPRLLLVTLAVAASPGRGTAEGAPPAPSDAQCLDTTCFASFWEARSFSAAGDACEGGGGHLMTVRSTVEAEAIALLLRGRAGSAWLGLRLPEGSCVQPAKQLRGFQWVAGDERTDYAAWASNGTNATSEAPACGPRCVVVTRELRWRERACDTAADGFLCEYSYPEGTCARLSPPPPDTAAAYLLPFGARETDLAALPPGTTADLPGLGVSLECQTRADGSAGWGRAAPGAWDCRLANGGCEGQCGRDSRGRPSCTCPEGRALREEDGRSCSAPCAGPGCPLPCLPQDDAGACVCMEGYEPDAGGRGCRDVDDCQAEPGPCEQQCVNTEGGFECRCFAGFELVEGRCLEDQQRCFDLACQHDCTRVEGRFRCTCYEGFVPDRRKPHECVLFCNQSQCPALCDPHTGESCDCPEGFVLDTKNGTTVCTDIDECGSGYCGDLKCVNTPGSYICSCPDGKFCLEEEESSGETEPTVLPAASPKYGLSRGMLVGIAVSVTVVVVLL
uniref:Thrombomodulin n=1 Tax=Pogona vitticeps TaxID=103695 RepID=A0ABM5GA62_9SAUR